MKKLIAHAACLLAISGTAFACGRDGTTSVPLAQLAVREATFSVSVDGRTATTFGTLKNSSANRVREVMFEVKYFDTKHALVDTFTRCVDNVIAPAAGEVAFRLREHLYQPAEAYVSQEVRVVSAEAIAPSPQQSALSPFMRELLITWLPLLALLGFLIYFMKRLIGKKSATTDALALMNAQIAHLGTQALMLERLALAAEARSRGTPRPGDD
ncbi:hypothetical protein [Massilia antarctica]|uniref:hypothetical protein n=1 Tax=Massilia antarctica TaxID=2765360 RepID=UPI0006BB84AE|nr:hypothetical protein [Massilia sp. H27-R4]MCY0913667.1 hypothetical protein [Massilia sp. H27-R4]CUI06077.1 hypothetical protein BN2497_6931 [Janthinobacterium sp. CG23_2]CUU29863.1 hypothetical protein BN3177_6931 [Janthinobacterium sp. CG23_2]